MGIMWTCAVILMLMGGNQVFAGTLTKGELVSMLTYTNQVVGSVSMVAMIIMMLTMTRESVTRINEVLDEVPDITDNGSTLKVENGEIEFRHVNFSYSGKMTTSRFLISTCTFAPVRPSALWAAPVTENRP